LLSCCLYWCSVGRLGNCHFVIKEEEKKEGKKSKENYGKQREEKKKDGNQKGKLRNKKRL